ncbi:MAG: chromosome segregation protein SMC, partial [Lachnospiraceae bacterium]|nr:chromosome segregation protein SMC [Lachnospiraceae bacterium]
QVDRILSAKAEERRELFDEACGIVKFKKRKNESLKKLEAERQNMVRLTDILSELERQVGPLKKQSENARQYLKLRDELRSYDINAFLIDTRSYEKALTQYREALKIASDHLSQAEGEADALKQDYADVEAEITSLDEKIEDIREKLAERESERAELESSVLVLEEKIRSEKTGIERFETRISEIEAEYRDRRQKAEDAEAEALQLEQELKTAGDSLEDLLRKIEEKETAIALYQSSVEASTGEVIGLLTEKSEVSASLQELETILSQNEIRRKEYADKLREYSERKAAASEEAEKYQNSCTKLLDELDEKNAALEEAESTFADAEKQFREAERGLQEAKQNLQVDRAKLESLKAIQERYEGFQPAVRSIMEEKKRRTGICGTVSDLIRVKSTYRTLIETALGGNFQNVIVDTEATAKALVTYLKENRLGRATFLPLDSIRPTGAVTDPKILAETGVIGTADQLVECRKEYLPAIRYLLERFLAVDTMENGLRIARKYHYTIRIVTLEGEFLNVGGSITGGSYKSSISVLGRGEEIAAFEKKIEETKKRIEEGERACMRFRQLKETASLDQEDLQEEIGRMNVALAEDKAHFDALKREIDVLAHEEKETEARIRETDDSSREASEKRDSILSVKARIEEANLKSSDSADEMKALLKKAEEEQSSLQAGAEELKLRVSHVKQRSAFLAESVENWGREKERLSEDRRSISESIVRANEAIEEYTESIEENKKSLEEAKGGDSGLRSTLSILNDEREVLTRSQKQYFDKRESLSAEINDLNREIFRLESAIEKNEEKTAALTEYLWTEYELLPSEAETYAKSTLLDEKPSEIRRHANELKAAIKALGAVNVAAIEQYKEVSERYEFLNAQYEDLKTAEQSLVNIITDLDNGMRKQFLEKFEEIRSEFDVVFKDLFGGGSARIALNPDADVIDSDITIISDPPGKKLTNMMQLSGGEKALTAIALIFAIQNLKPSPFCLLDEIEAALDDTNIVRFTNYLKKLALGTQYIVITHRRGTMVAADRLYGITMQEKGVSTLVSVNLVEQELDA